MANSNVQLLGLSTKLLERLGRAQDEIDACVKKGYSASFELLNEFSQHGNTYAINLDSATDVVHEDVVSARIFPRKDFQHEESFFKNELQKYTITELEKNIALVAKKIFDVGVLMVNLLIVLLVKLDALCEKILTKGYVYMQGVSDASQEDRVTTYEMQAVQKEQQYEKAVLLHDVVSQRETPLPVHTQHVQHASQYSREQRNEGKSPVLSMVVYTCTVLYNELRYGAKSSI